jgi:hypothetical protein
LKPEETLVSKVMTRNPIFVMAETLAVEALQKMVQGELLVLCVVLIFNSVTEVVPGYLWQYGYPDIDMSTWFWKLIWRFAVWR